MASLTKRSVAYPVFVALSFILLGLFSGCATQTPVEEVEEMPELMWPSPPDQPVIKYLNSYSAIEELDIKKKPKFADILAGAKEEDETAQTLEKPFGVFVDSNDRLFVADTILGALIVFDQKTGQAEHWGDSGPGRLSKPISVAVDQYGRVFVADVTDRRVVIFDSSGKFLNAFGGKETFENPVAIAINENLGRIYVADSKLHQIKMFDMEGVELAAVGEKGFDPGQFMFPTYLAIGSDNRVFVSDAFNFRIQILDSDMNSLKSFGQVGQRPGDLNRPKGIALDSDGHVYVVDASFNNFQIFTEDGELLLFVGEMGSAPGQFTLPTGIHIDKNNKIYIADQLNKRVQVFEYLGEPNTVPIDSSESEEKSE